MGFITGFTDVQDVNGNSIVQATGPNGTRSPLVLKMGAGVVASFAQSGDLGIVTLSVAAGAPVTGSATTTDATTATALVAIPIPTGQRAWLRFTISAEVTTGSNTGKAAAWEEAIFVRNPTGTPAASTGTYSPTPPMWVFCDELSAAVAPAAISLALAANMVTINVVGIAATTVKWGITVTPVYFAE